MTRLNKFKVLLLQDIPESAITTFQQADYEVEHINVDISEAQLVKKIADAHVIGIGHRTSIPLTDEILRFGHRLLAVCCFCMQTNDVDMHTANLMGTAVFNSPYGDTASIAELVIGYLVGLARELFDRSREVHQGIWKKKSAGCHELRGKTLGIIGYGLVGSLVGILAEGIGMRVIWYDEKPLMPIGNSEACNSMEDVFKRADFVSLHVADAPENHNLIRKEHFDKMKSKSYFINTSFGHAVDLTALVHALKEGHLAGAAIDVFPSEAYDLQNKNLVIELAQCSNVILTPHIGDATIEGKHRVGTEVASHVIRYINQGSTIGCVNLSEIDVDSLRPNTRRITNIHKNVRGVVKEIDHIISDVNIVKQIIETNGDLGYIVIDIDSKKVTADIVADLAAMGNTIRTRIL